MARNLHEWSLRLWGTFGRRRSDVDLEEELRLHLELAAEDARRRGETAEEAERVARIRVGGATQAMEALRDQRGLPWIDAAVSGLDHLPGLVFRHRGYFLFATTTLAVAVGVNLVVFTVVNALWLRPLPIADADRLVALPASAYASVDAPRFKIFGGGVAGQVITDDLLGDLRALKPQITFDRIGRNLETLAVTAGYFRVLGLGIRGRDFTADDNRAGAEPVAIISDRLWSRELGRREDVIGAVIAANPVAIRVIGVAPPGFEGARRGEKADAWIPSALLPRVVPFKAEESNPLMIFARLGRGQTIADVDRLVQQKYANSVIDKDYLKAVPLKDVFGTPESHTIVIREGNSLAIVGGLAMLVLLGGCATLAALVLVHYERRRAELAVRLALGASRLRLVGELYRELLLVAATGTLGAILVATWGLHVIPSLSLPGGVDLGRLDLSIDWRVLVAAMATTFLTLLAAAWLPISRFTRADLAKDLVGGPAPTPSAASHHIRQGLLALHVSATVVVLIAAGLFVRAVVLGFGSAPGSDVDHTLFVDVQLWPPWSGPPTGEDITTQAVNRVRDALRSLPGVNGAAEGMPPIGPEATRFLQVPVAMTTDGQQRGVALGRLAGSPNLLATLGVPLVAGRELTQADATAQPVPTVMTASLARMLWPTEDPLGQVVSMGRGGRLLIVGLARDFVFGSLTKPAAGVVTTTRGTLRGIDCEFVVRAAHPEAVAELILKVLKATVPDAPIVTVTTGRDIIAHDLGRQRLGAWFFSGFGLVALLLGVVGVFGLVAYLAESRQREFGIRLALGATSRDLVQIGLLAALVPVLMGLAAGLVFAGWVARVFTSLLSGLSALDPLTYAGVGLTMVSCAALAALSAAWRVRRLSPSEALRAI